MKKLIFHIASWYPTDTDPFNGDFIQRHIETLSSPVYKHIVLYANRTNDAKRKNELQLVSKGSIHENIIYYKPFNGVLNPIYHLYFLYKLWNMIAKSQGQPLMTHSHVAIYGGIFAVFLKWKYNIPFVLTEHSSLFTKNKLSTTQIIKRWIGYKVMKQADFVLPVSNDLNGRLKKKCNYNQFQVIHNVVNDRFFKVALKKKKEATCRFIHVSSLIDEVKNIKGIIAAFELLKKTKSTFHLTIVGNYNLKKTANELESSTLSKQDYNLVGPLSQKELANLMSHQDVFVLFSNYENFPCVLIEAKAVGLDIIATDVGGVSEIVEENDILIEAGNVFRLIEALKLKTEINTGSNRELIRKQAFAKYSSKIIGKQMEDVYEKIENESFI